MAHVALPAGGMMHGTTGVVIVMAVAAVRLARAVSPHLFAYLRERLRLRAAMRLAEVHPDARVEVSQHAVVIHRGSIGPVRPTSSVPLAADATDTRLAPPNQLLVDDRPGKRRAPPRQLTTDDDSPASPWAL